MIAFYKDKDELCGDVSSLNISEFRELCVEMDSFLNAQNQTGESDNTRLKKRNAVLEEQNASLKKEIISLKKKIDSLILKRNSYNI